MRKWKKAFSGLVAIGLCIGLLLMPAKAEAAGFIDVREPFVTSINWAVSQGITNGTTATTFSPDRTLTRAEMVTFLYRYAGEPEVEITTKFKDMPGNVNFQRAISWAVNHGITMGTTSDRFAPDAFCTREQMLTFLYRYAGEPAVTVTSSIADLPENQTFRKAISWGLDHGITSGKGVNLAGKILFKGEDPCTRAQAVTFIYRGDSGGAISAGDNPGVDMMQNKLEVRLYIPNDVTDYYGANPSDGTPMAAAKVKFYRYMTVPGTESGYWEEIAEKMTDGTGTVVLENLAEAQYKVGVQENGFTSFLDGSVNFAATESLTYSTSIPMIPTAKVNISVVDGSSDGEVNNLPVFVTIYRDDNFYPYIMFYSNEEEIDLPAGTYRFSLSSLQNYDDYASENFVVTKEHTDHGIVPGLYKIELMPKGVG